MKRLHTLLVPLVIVALLPFLTGAAFPFSFWKAAAASFQSASDAFTYTNAAALGSQTNWTNATASSSLTVANNGTVKGVRGTAASTNSVVFYNQLTWSANQYSQAYLVNVNGTTINNGGVAVRCNTTSGGNCYAAVYVAGTIYLNVLNSGTFSTVTTRAISLSVGNGIKLSVTGSGAATLLNIYADTGSGFVLQGAGNIDPGGTYVSTGSPGMASYDTASSSADWGTWAASEQ